MNRKIRGLAVTGAIVIAMVMGSVSTFAAAFICPNGNTACVNAGACVRGCSGHVHTSQCLNDGTCATGHIHNANCPANCGTHVHNGNCIDNGTCGGHMHNGNCATPGSCGGYYRNSNSNYNYNYNSAGSGTGNSGYARGGRHHGGGHC